jgi:hypothetical protein
MVMIVCGECGRAVSSKAAACVGCGAPIEIAPGINPVQRAGKPTPLNSRTVRRHLYLAIATLLLGVAAAVVADRAHGPGRGLSLAAALLLIVGIAWTLVGIVRLWTGRAGDP